MDQMGSSGLNSSNIIVRGADFDCERKKRGRRVMQGRWSP